MFKKFFMAVVVLAGGALLMPARVTAHHAFAAEFDENLPISFDGVLTKMEWVNPHAWLHVAVKNPKTGQVEEWMIEGGAPNNLIRHGFGKNAAPIGTEIHVEGYHAKVRDVNRGNGHILTIKATGQAFFLGSSGTGAPYDTKPGTEYDANGRPIVKK